MDQLEDNASTSMPDPEFQRLAVRTTEFLARRESQARTPAEAARLRDWRHRQERLLQTDAERLLPCPECGKWNDLSSGVCTLCAKPMSFAGVIVLSGAWKVYLTFGFLFTGIAFGCGLAAFGSDYPLLIKAVAFVVLLVTAPLMLSYWRHMVMAAIWLLRRPR